MQNAKSLLFYFGFGLYFLTTSRLLSRSWISTISLFLFHYLSSTRKLFSVWTHLSSSQNNSLEANGCMVHAKTIDILRWNRLYTRHSAQITQIFAIFDLQSFAWMKLLLTGIRQQTTTVLVWFSLRKQRMFFADETRGRQRCVFLGTVIMSDILVSKDNEERNLRVIWRSIES